MEGKHDWFNFSGVNAQTRYCSDFEKQHCSSSIRDGGIGRNPSLPRTMKRRVTTNLQTINNKKCQKIKLHGTPTTKELKKQSTRPTRPVRGRQAEGDQREP